MHRFITTAPFRMAIILTSSENIFSEQKKRITMFHAPTEIDRFTLRACLHGVGNPGLVGLVSFVFTLWGTQNKRNLPH